MVALFVVLTFILFVVVDLIVLRAQKKKHPAFEQPASSAVFNWKSLVLPGEVYLSKGHTWLKVSEEGTARIGIDEFVTKALGNVALLNYVPADSRIKAGDILFAGKAGHRTVSFRSPVDGTVKAVNETLLTRHVTDPYGDDWAIEIVPENLEKDVKALRSGAHLSNWLKEEFSRLKEFLAETAIQTEPVGVTMHDGGNIMEGAVAHIKEEGVAGFEKQFLTF